MIHHSAIKLYYSFFKVSLLMMKKDSDVPHEPWQDKT